MSLKWVTAFGLLCLALLLFAPSAEAGDADCGGAGQRACCNGCFPTLELSNNGTACDSGNFIFGTTTELSCGSPCPSFVKTKDICVAPPPCGGAGQRACCFLEGGRTDSCNAGLVEGPGCGPGNASCMCAGGSFSSGVCTAPACGGPGQRGCCLGSEQTKKGLSGPCSTGNIELGSCSSQLGGAACACLVPAGSSSSGVCNATNCGGPGQRGCCVGAERTVNNISGPCKGNAVEIGTCTGGDCACTSPAGSSSSGRCVVPSACGGEGQRACVGAEGAACQQGLVQTGTSLANIFGFSSQSCTSQLGVNACVSASGVVSSGTCQRVHCGGDGERGCCIGDERAARGIAGPCVSGAIEDLSNGCTGGNCACTGTLAVGNSSGICQTVTACGGKDQRACCVGVGEFPSNPGFLPDSVSCTQGMIEIAGCTGDDCYCGGAGTGQKSAGMCRENTHPTPCGGPGQRACCAGTFEVVLGKACNTGAVEVPGCGGGSCLCGGFNPFSIQASSMCITPSTCGGEGQRACCTAKGEFPSSGGVACGFGLIEVPGCSGDCFCGGGPLFPGSVSLTSCTAPVFDTSSGQVPPPFVSLKPIAEPGLSWTPPNEGPVCGMRGYADMHLHLFAEMAHGGAVLAGKAWDANGINEALKQDFGTNLDLVSKTNTSNYTVAEVPPPDCPSWLPNCGVNVFHGTHTLEDVVGLFSGDASNSNLGVPLFNGWPRWSNVTHQQVYYKWLERAWRGGLRLVSMLAVSNEALCLGNKKVRDTACDNSMKPLDEQIKAAKDFQTWLDTQSGGPGQGWFRIVTSPADARRVIGLGKLAVVLGIEVDNLFNCKANGKRAWTWRNNTWVSTPNESCDEFFVRQEVQRYAALGVRHVFPIHNFDNYYGATATWYDSINVGNRVSEGFYFAPEECSSQGYGFGLSSFDAGYVSQIGFSGLELPPDYGSFTATCNSKGLTSVGNALIDEMMKQKMLIDVDHMGNKAFDQTLTLAEQFTPAQQQQQQQCSIFNQICGNGVCCPSWTKRRDTCAATENECNAGYPVLASHVIPFDLVQQSARTERMRTSAQFARIKALKGMVAPITEMRDTDGDGNKVSIQYGDVANDCRKSTKTFASVFQKTVDLMDGPVGIGSDFNGTAWHLSPRFGNEGCDSVASERSGSYREGNRLQYPFTLEGFGTLGKQVTGEKTFDYNVDGMAHVGLLPDFVADMKQIGVPDATLERLWQSAQGFVDLWDRVEGNSPTPASIGESQWGGGQCKSLRGPNGYPVEIPVDDQCQVSPELVGQIAAGDGRLTATISPAGPFNRYTLYNQNYYSGTCVDVTATESCSTQGGTSSSCNGCFKMVDRTPPQLNCPGNVTAEKTGNLTFPSIPSVTVSDNCATQFYDQDYQTNNFFGCSRYPSQGFPLGTTTVTCTGRDDFQNQSSCSYTVTIIPPKTPQTISFTQADKTYGDAPFALVATATSGLTVSFSRVSGPVTLLGNMVTITGVGTVVIRATQGGSALYAPATEVLAQFDIQPKAQTITFDPLPDRSYGDSFLLGASASSGLPVSYTLSGPAALSGDTVTITGVGPVSITASQAGDTSGNSFAPSVTRSFTAYQRRITVTAEAKAKTYGDPDPSLTWLITAGNVVFPSDSLTGTLARTLGENVGAHAIQQGTLSVNSNYALTFVGNYLVIGTRPITVTAEAKAKTYGDQDPSLTWLITSGNVVFASDALTGALTRDAGEKVGAYAIRQGTLAVNDNYALTFVGNFLVIGTRAITVAAEAKSKTYGDPDPALSYSITAGGIAFPGESFMGALKRVAGENIGSYAIERGSLELSGNYDVTFVGSSLSIGTRGITVTADAKTKTYGEADPELTYSIVGGSLGFSDAFTGALVRTPGENIGPYAIHRGSLELSGNYDLAFTGSSLSIGARAVTATAHAKTKTYGDSDPALTYSISSGSLGFNDAFAGALTRAVGEDVGPHAILQGTLALSNNYDFTFVGSNLTVGARPVTAKADAKSKTYGDSDPALTYAITSGNLAFSDAFAGALTRAVGEDVGPHAIQQGTLALSGNYEFTFVESNLTIGARAVTAKADAKSKTYGDSDPALTYAITSGTLAFSDAFAGALTRAVGEDIGPHAIQQGTLALGGNYELTFVGSNLTIGQRALTVTADTKTKTYGDPDVLTYAITSGSLAFSDAFAGALTRAPGENIGLYAIQQGSLGLSGNYDFSFVGAKLTIIARHVTIAADAKSKIYSGPDPALTHQIVSGVLVGNDAFSGSLVRALGENIGPYGISQGSVTLGDNYALGYVGADLTILPKPLSITANNRAKTYGETVTFAGAEFSVDGLAFSDSVASVTLSSAGAPAGAIVGGYAIAPSGAVGSGLGNYTIAYHEGQLAVAKAPVVVVWTGALAGTFNHPASLIANLTFGPGSAIAGTPIAGKPLSLVAGAQGCASVTGPSGSAACTLTINQPQGTYPAVTTFAGDSNFLPASASAPFAISRDASRVVYTGPALIANGHPLTVSGTVTSTFNDQPAAGVSVAFVLGAQGCTGVTDASGSASCTIATVTQPLGPTSIATSFAGNEYYLAASDSDNALVFAYPIVGGSFVVANSAAVVGRTVTFWGSQWAQENLPSAPSSFKGFAVAAPTTCGGTFSTSTGTSSAPPATVPAYMAVIATSLVVKSGSILSGDNASIVIVKTSPGYGPDGLQAGTGIVVAVLCGGGPPGITGSGN